MYGTVKLLLVLSCLIYSVRCQEPVNYDYYDYDVEALSETKVTSKDPILIEIPLLEFPVKETILESEQETITEAPSIDTTTPKVVKKRKFVQPRRRPTTNLRKRPASLERPAKKALETKVEENVSTTGETKKTSTQNTGRRNSAGSSRFSRNRFRPSTSSDTLSENANSEPSAATESSRPSGRRSGFRPRGSSLSLQKEAAETVAATEAPATSLSGRRSFRPSNNRLGGRNTAATTEAPETANQSSHRFRGGPQTSSGSGRSRFTGRRSFEPSSATVNDVPQEDVVSEDEEQVSPSISSSSSRRQSLSSRFSNMRRRQPTINNSPPVPNFRQNRPRPSVRKSVRPSFRRPTNFATFTNPTITSTTTNLPPTTMASTTTSEPPLQETTTNILTSSSTESTITTATSTTEKTNPPRTEPPTTTTSTTTTTTTPAPLATTSEKPKSARSRLPSHVRIFPKESVVEETLTKLPHPISIVTEFTTTTKSTTTTTTPAPPATISEKHKSARRRLPPRPRLSIFSKESAVEETLTTLPHPIFLVNSVPNESRIENSELVKQLVPNTRPNLSPMAHMKVVPTNTEITEEIVPFSRPQLSARPRIKSVAVGTGLKAIPAAVVRAATSPTEAPIIRPAGVQQNSLGRSSISSQETKFNEIRKSTRPQRIRITTKRPTTTVPTTPSPSQESQAPIRSFGRTNYGGSGDIVYKGGEVVLTQIGIREDTPPDQVRSILSGLGGRRRGLARPPAQPYARPAVTTSTTTTTSKPSAVDDYYYDDYYYYDY